MYLRLRFISGTEPRVVLMRIILYFTLLQSTQLSKLSKSVTYRFRLLMWGTYKKMETRKPDHHRRHDPGKIHYYWHPRVNVKHCQWCILKIALQHNKQYTWLLPFCCQFRWRRFAHEEGLLREEHILPSINFTFNALFYHEWQIGMFAW